jgi:hypothetical protein
MKADLCTVYHVATPKGERVFPPCGISRPWARITVEFLHAGQPRPYADSVYEALILIEGGTPSTEQGMHLPMGHKRPMEQVKELVRCLVHEFSDEGHALDARLDTLEVVEETDTYRVWRAVVTDPYKD